MIIKSKIIITTTIKNTKTRRKKNRIHKVLEIIKSIRWKPNAGKNHGRRLEIRDCNSQTLSHKTRKKKNRIHKVFILLVYCEGGR